MKVILITLSLLFMVLIFPIQVYAADKPLERKAVSILSGNTTVKWSQNQNSVKLYLMNWGNSSTTKMVSNRAAAKKFMLPLK